MTEEQLKISRSNCRKTRRLLNVLKGYVMHHKDKSLRTENIERYILWLPEDLEVMTRSEHVALHNHDKNNVKFGEDNRYHKWVINNPEKQHEYLSKRVSARNKTLWQQEEYRKKMNDIMHKSQRMAVMNLQTGEVYESVREAERQTGISRYKITHSDKFKVFERGVEVIDVDD